MTTEELSARTAFTTEKARLNIAVSGFWGGRFEKTIIHVRVFDPHAPSNKIAVVDKNAMLSMKGRRREHTSKGN